MYDRFEEDKRLVSCVPTQRQLRHQQMEFYGFIHFTVNTFTDKEWGDGTEDEKIFDPVALDAAQWVSAAKSAGMTGLILTAKHHDGFCLWPSAYTEHSVKNSPFRGGKGDVVKEVADACREGGIRFGIYLSPWDRNCPVYGQGKAYDDFFCHQLEELLTNYGDVFCVWFDGACGEGPNGKKQVYDWNRYYALIREKQPDACISVCGPDVRWCGNESGRTRASEWSVIPNEYDNNDFVASISQHKAEKPVYSIDSVSEDLGSRDFLADKEALEWKHAETNTSIRPGWFYHKSENIAVKSLKTLLDIYFRSVGGNSTFLLNLPPDRNGLIPEPDVKRLIQLGDALSRSFADNLIKNAVITADSDDGFHPVTNVLTDDYDTYFKTEDGVNTAVITVTFPESRKIKLLEIRENLLFSQRIESFSVECQNGKHWRTIGAGTTVGYKKLLRFRPVNTSAIRIIIHDSRVCPVISHIAVY